MQVLNLWHWIIGVLRIFGSTWTLCQCLSPKEIDRNCLLVFWQFLMPCYICEIGKLHQIGFITYHILIINFTLYPIFYTNFKHSLLNLHTITNHRKKIRKTKKIRCLSCGVYLGSLLIIYKVNKRKNWKSSKAWIESPLFQRPSELSEFLLLLLFLKVVLFFPRTVNFCPEYFFNYVSKNFMEYRS